MIVEIEVEGKGQTVSMGWDVEADMLFLLMTAVQTKESVIIKATSACGPVTTETTIEGIVLSVQRQKTRSASIHLPSMGGS